jgi:PKD repeat protein
MKWWSAVAATILLLCAMQAAAALEPYELARSWMAGNDTPHAIAMGIDGRLILVGGSDDNGGAWFASCNADGTGWTLLPASFAVGEPLDLAVNATGAIYVVDQDWSPGGDDGPGVCLFGPNGVPYKLYHSWWEGGTQHWFSEDIGGIGIGPDGDVYITNRSEGSVLRFGPDMTFKARYGSQGTGENEFTNPMDVAVGGTVDHPIVYVNDIVGVSPTVSTRVARFEPTAGGGMAGWSTWTSPGSFLSFLISLDRHGNLFLVDAGFRSLIQNAPVTTDRTPVTSGYTIFKFSPTGTLLASFGPTGTSSQHGTSVVVDGSENVYVPAITLQSGLSTDRFAPVPGSVDVWRPVRISGTFAAYPESGTAPLTVQFLDYTANGRFWTWDFGDGGSSDRQYPVHIYNQSGLYTVSVTVTDWAGETVTKTMHHLIRVAAPVTPVPTPVADFSANATAGAAPLTVAFTDASSPAPNHRWWQFGDGESSTDANPVHTFARQGTYTVNLSVWTERGQATVSKPAYITVGPDPRAPKANFTMSRSSGKVPFAVRITDTSTGNPTSWRWDLTGGSWTQQRNPTVYVRSPGIYALTLTATNAYGSSQMTKTITATGSATRSGKGDAVGFVG